MIDKSVIYHRPKYAKIDWGKFDRAVKVFTEAGYEIAYTVHNKYVIQSRHVMGTYIYFKNYPETGMDINELIADPEGLVERAKKEGI